MLGLSIEGPGSRTAEPVPDEVTRWPALLVKKLLDLYIREDDEYARQNKMAFHRTVLLSGIKAAISEN